MLHQKGWCFSFTKEFPFQRMPNYEHNIYKTKIASDLWNYHGKIYYGTREGTFKQPYGNHKNSFNHEKHRTDTQLSMKYWRLKELKAKPQVQFYILKRCRPVKRIGICYVCFNKKHNLVLNFKCSKNWVSSIITITESVCNTT